MVTLCVKFQYLLHMVSLLCCNIIQSTCTEYIDNRFLQCLKLCIMVPQNYLSPITTHRYCHCPVTVTILKKQQQSITIKVDSNLYIFSLFINTKYKNLTHESVLLGSCSITFLSNCKTAATQQSGMFTSACCDVTVATPTNRKNFVQSLISQ